MIELQALAALLAFERAPERALERARHLGALAVMVAVGGMTLGWIVGATGRRAS